MNQLDVCQALSRQTDRLLRTKKPEAARAKVDFQNCKHAETLKLCEVSELQECVDELEIRICDPFPYTLMGLAEVAVSYKVRDVQGLANMNSKQLGKLFNDLIPKGILLNEQLCAATASLNQKELHYLCNELKILMEHGGKYEFR
jgi:hypothetical protein